MLNRTDAWLCSDGSCYTDKRKAYSEEIRILLATIPKGNVKPLTMYLERVVNEAERWLLQADELNEKIKKTSKGEQHLVVEEFRGIVDKVHKWVGSSRSLLRQMEKEPDPEIRRDIAQQSG